MSHHRGVEAPADGSLSEPIEGKGDIESPPIVQPIGVCAGTIALYLPAEGKASTAEPTLVFLESAIKDGIKARLGLDASVELTWTSK